MKRVITILAILTGLTAQTVSAQEYSWTNLPVANEPSFRTDTFNIRDYGAKDDGISLNTKNINGAITECSQKGGGVVLVPGGIWLTGPIEMKSNVNLHIVRGAILLFTKDFNQYALVEGVFEGKRSARNQSPVYGNNLTNVAITGEGVVDGNGDVWRMVGKDRLTEAEWKIKIASGGLVSKDGKLWFPSARTKLAFEEKRGATMEPGQTLKDFEELLPQAIFIRIHHSYIINKKSIRKYIRGEGGQVVMSNGRTLDVARRKKEEFLKAIGA